MSFKYPLKSKKRILDPGLLFEAMGNPVKRMLISPLIRHQPTIALLQEISGMSYHGLYQHLKQMEETGLITSYKIGIDKYYTINPEALESLSRWLTMLSKQLRASNTNHQDPYGRNNLSDAKQIGSNGRKEDRYS